MLAQLAIKNIKYYRRSYGVYLATLILSGWIYYTFTMLVGTQLRQVGHQGKTSSMVIAMGSAVILLFAAFFVIYSVNFFFRKREREIGLYFLLGMKRQSVSWLLLIETITMGIVAVAIGMGIGFFTAWPIHNLMDNITGITGLSLCQLSFGQWMSALGKYLIIFLLAAFIQTKRLTTRQLMALFHGELKGEYPVKTNGWTATLAILMMVIGYVLIFQVKGGKHLYFLPSGFSLVLAGTVWGCQQGFGWLSGWLRSSNYCATNLSKLVNVVGLRHRIRGNTNAWSVLSFLIAMTTGCVVVIQMLYEIARQMEPNFGIGHGNPATNAVMNTMYCLMALLFLSCLNFMANAGSMIYFQVMHRLRGDKHSFHLLRCLGATPDELKKIAVGESRIMFLIPYVMGLFHTVMFVVYMHQINLLHHLSFVGLSVAICGAIYLAYYEITKIAGKRLI